MKVNDNKYGLKYVSYNQDGSCFSCGGNGLFKIYEIDRLKERFTREYEGNVRIVEMFYKTNILIIVDENHPHKASVWDDIDRKFVAEFEFRYDIVGVKVRKKKLIIITVKNIYIYNFTNLKLADTFETCNNPLGICAINMDEDNLVLAAPTSIGSVKVYIRGDEKDITYNIDAHNGRIRYLTLDGSGKYLATCSEKGTIIRIFDTNTGNKMCELRRGKRQADIQSMEFNMDGKKLCVTSNTGTVHVYDLEIKEKQYSILSLVNVVYNNDALRSYITLNINETQSLCKFNTHGDILILGGSGTCYRYVSIGDGYKLYDKNIYFSE